MSSKTVYPPQGSIQDLSNSVSGLAMLSLRATTRNPSIKVTSDTTSTQTAQTAAISLAYSTAVA
jgi:hypothetical protein